jgi:ribonuclease HI
MAPAARILVYADGSCEGNPGPGGWGVVIIGQQEPQEFSGSDPQTTNNRMELTAAIEGLRRLEPGSNVTLRSDSQYLVNTMNLGWRRGKNNDLWKALDAEVAKRDVRFEWVRGHANDPLNEAADRLAREATRNVVRGSRGSVSTARRMPAAGAIPALEIAEVADDAAAASELRSLLCAGEEISRCFGCGEAFVAMDGDRYCSRVRCQLAARRPMNR